MLSIGIRREAKNQWERRVPLSPNHVQKLVQSGVKVYIEPSTKRIFSDREYANYGAILTQDLSAADIIVGVKEVPVPHLLPNKTYLFFSHTHKGQPHNMPLLNAVLTNVTLI